MPADPKQHRTITRVIEYHGSPDWIEKTIAASRIPLQGVFYPSHQDQSVWIKSGVLVWQPEVIEQRETETSEPTDVTTVIADTLISRAGDRAMGKPEVTGSTGPKFVRPGEGS